MLVLGRKLGEEVWVGGEIRITIVKLDGRTVRLGIEAPRDVRVDRAEIYAKARARQPRPSACARAIRPAA